MKKMKKMIETVIGMAVLLALSGGCAHTSQSGEQSNIDFESLDTDTQVVASQVETNVDSREEHQKETAVIGEEGIKEAIMKKFGDVILSNEFKAKNIWMEYFPLLREGSFTEMDLIPVWCVEFEVDGQSVEDSRYSIRFNAVTGEEIS